MWNQLLVPVSIHAINNILSNSLRWIFQISIMKCVDHLTAMGLCVDNALKVMVYIPVYSYDLSCVECTDYKYNWLKYMAVAYGPLTVFYFIIIIFRISANSGSMIGYVTISQMVSNTYLNYIYLKNPSFCGNNKIICALQFHLESEFLSIALPSFLPSPSSLSSAGNII